MPTCLAVRVLFRSWRSIVLALPLVALACGGETADGPTGWDDATHSTKATPAYETVFPASAVKRIEIKVAAVDWEAMNAQLGDMIGMFGGGFQNAKVFMRGMGGAPLLTADLVPETPIWRQATVTFEGRRFEHVGLRFKGNSSLALSWINGKRKLPFKLDFDRFADEHPQIEGQRFFGFEEVSFSSNYGDPSVLREKVTADLFREGGIPAPRTAYYRVYVDHGAGSLYFGLYTAVEVPDKPLFEAQLGASGGNLYKPDPPGGHLQKLDENSIGKENNEQAADFSDVKALIDAVNASRADAAAWRAGLEKVLDVDHFLRWLAINTLVQNWDTYGGIAHNYFLYAHPRDGRFKWIPWDNNEAMKPRSFFASAVPLDFATVTNEWPLLRHVIDDPEYQKTYVAHLRAALTGVFAVAPTHERFVRENALIRPYVVGAEGEVAPERTFLMSPVEFDNAMGIEGLKSHVVARHEAANAFLAGGAVVPVGGTPPAAAAAP